MAQLQPRPRFSSGDAAAVKCLGLNPADGRIECWFKPSDFAATPGGGAWETGVVTRVNAKRTELFISFPTTAGEWAPWPEPISLTETKWRPGWSQLPPGSAPQQAVATEWRGTTRPRQTEANTARKRQRHDSGQQAPGASGAKRRDVPEQRRFVTPPEQLERRPWLAGGTTLRQALLALQISATGRLAGAGNELVGDRLPRCCWTCARPDWVFLPAEFDNDPTGTFRVLREQQSLEVNRNSKPMVIHSRAVAQRYARAVASIKEPGVCPPKYRGRGRKLVILFDWKDREKMVERMSDGLPIYINPLDPPRDPGHPCWAATCYFVELRADLADTLVIPAGMMHFVLTVEDSTLVCIELSSPIASELTASLQVVQTVRQLQELDPHKRDTYTFYDRWITAGFDTPTMLHKGIDLLCHDAGGRTAEEDDAGGMRKALEQYRQWLQKEVYLPPLASQTPKGSSSKQPQLPAASHRRRRAYEHVYRHLALALEMTRCRAAPDDGCGNGPSSASRQEFPELQHEHHDKRSSLQVVMKALAKAEKKAKAQAAQSVDSMPPEWARDPSATEQVTLYRTGMHLLTDNAYNDDRGKSFEDGTEDGGERPKASARRKQGNLISGRSAGRLAAARFLADADEIHPGNCSSTVAQNFSPAAFCCDRHAACPIQTAFVSNLCVRLAGGTASCTKTMIDLTDDGAAVVVCDDHADGGRPRADAAPVESGSARAVFFEGFQSKQLATALDVERCGGQRGQGEAIRHGCTSLLMQERGAVTQLHFDTGPYSAISFHLCQEVASDG